MKGSQLKKLKAALKAHGLTGNSNVKKVKKAKKRLAKEYDKEERDNVISKIREEFNPFDVKVIRNKKKVFSKGESKISVGRPGISKQIGNEMRSKLYEVGKKQKNRAGGFIDRRFGERDKDLTVEEIMLERFTREHQAQSRRDKKLLFNLDDEEDELTHMGQIINVGDDGEVDQESIALNDGDGPVRKKTKAEVMKEIIAKSKFYKYEKQKAREKLEEQIEDLDDNFEDIMSELRSVETPVTARVGSKAEDTVYERKLRELGLDRRAVPVDRTKTDEEIRAENEAKIMKLEQDRINRMNGILQAESEDIGVEDLGNDFWERSDSENEELNEDINLDCNFETLKKVSAQQLSCPSTHQELLMILQDYPATDHSLIIKRIINSYQPRLAEGNKERLGDLTGALFRHILYLGDEYISSGLDEIEEVQNSLISILKSMSEKYNKAISKTCREIITEMQKRFKECKFTNLLASDLVFFSLVGLIFSTSDHYHLVVTACSILMGELLDQVRINSYYKLIYCTIIANISLKYQRISRRYIPELTYFLKKALVSLLPKNEASTFLARIKIDSEKLSIPVSSIVDQAELSLHLKWLSFKEYDESIVSVILGNILSTLNNAVDLLWKDLPGFPEIVHPFLEILTVYSSISLSYELPKKISDKIERLMKFNEHYPLSLQHHKPISIPSYMPKFEENFNPERKSYDPDRTRSDINKMKAELKKKRKFEMKELRKDTRFEAQKRIEEQKISSEQYHAKMSRIINQINTEEGAEKNKYEREKKLRNSKR